MTKSTKAALLSGLIFPGIGHIVLKQYVRGSILALVALLAVSAMVKGQCQQWSRSHFSGRKQLSIALSAEKFRWKQELFQNWLLIPPTIRTALYRVFL